MLCRSNILFDANVYVTYKSVSGFVAQGSPDLILKSLADRYEQECKDGIKDGVGNLTLLFGGGPGDWER